jgi:AbrB family looped-hinge helix DNA binding protein
MNIGKIILTNQKGQIVIPSDFRQKLGIKANTYLNVLIQNDSIVIKPIKEIHSDSEIDDSYYFILKDTQGSWAEDEEMIKEEDIKSRKRELSAAKRRKKEW